MSYADFKKRRDVPQLVEPTPQEIDGGGVGTKEVPLEASPTPVVQPEAVTATPTPIEPIKVDYNYGGLGLVLTPNRVTIEKGQFEQAPHLTGIIRTIMIAPDGSRLTVLVVPDLQPEEESPKVEPEQETMPNATDETSN